MIKTTSLLSALLLTVLAVAQTARATEPDLAYLQAQKFEYLSELIKPIRACVQRRDTSHVLFHGCIDWHSATHGYWALTAAARLTNNATMKAALLSAFTPAAIEAEHTLLKRRPAFEMPYGRAWFLRLVVEFERTFGDKRFRPMARTVALSLVEHLSSKPIRPLSDSYQGDSWALLNLRAYGVHTSDTGLLTFVDEIVTRHFQHAQFQRAHFQQAMRRCPLNSDQRNGSFMAACTNLAWLVSEVMDSQDYGLWLADLIPVPDRLSVVQEPHNIHLYGLNFSRAWGLWRMYRKTGERIWLRHYRQHFETTYHRPSWWRGHYRRVGHWVAQFGVFAIMPLFEPDYR